MGNIIGGPGAAIGGTSVPVINTGAAVVGIPRPLSPGLNYGERCVKILEILKTRSFFI